MSETSTKPYLLRALYEWCTDNGYTPYVVVVVDASTRVPVEFVKNGEIVLNISFEATGNLKMDNDFIHFKARFGGVAREIEVPVSNVSAIYARENGQGMSFEVQRNEESPRKKSSGVIRRKRRGQKFLPCCLPCRQPRLTLINLPETTVSPILQARVADQDLHGSNKV